MIVTRRLRLVPATAALVRAEIADHAALGRMLSALIPPDWPPSTLADALPVILQPLEDRPESSGWCSWYGLIAGEEPVFGVSAGFKGPPLSGTVEIGYSVLEAFQGKGLGTEAVRGLLRWALEQRGVERVAAETAPGNLPSLRVLAKAGFRPAGVAADPRMLRFEIVAAPGSRSLRTPQG